MKKIIFLLFTLGFTLCFSQTQTTEVPPNQDSTVESKTPKTVTPAESPGGIPAFMQDVSKAIKISRVKGAKGQVQSKAKFSVGPNGVIDQVMVTGANPDLNSEVERVLKTMKTKWTPGKIDGEPGSIWYAVPVVINFD